MTSIAKLNSSKTSSEIKFLFPCLSFGTITWERPKTSELCLYLAVVSAWQYEHQYSSEREDIRKEISSVKVTLKYSLKKINFKVSC